MISRRMGKIRKAKQMNLNKNKIKIMAVSGNKNTNPLDIKIREVQIEDAKEYKYLGVRLFKMEM